MAMQIHVYCPVSINKMTCTSAARTGILQTIFAERKFKKKFAIVLHVTIVMKLFQPNDILTFCFVDKL